MMTSFIIVLENARDSGYAEVGECSYFRHRDAFISLLSDERPKLR